MTNYKYFNFDKSPWVSYECYFISGTTELWDKFLVCPRHENSIVSIQVMEAALLGLDINHFYDYIALTYNARVKRSKGIVRSISFETVKDAAAFVKELNRRMDYAVANKFFEVEDGDQI